FHQANPGYVAARPREAGDDSLGDRIAHTSQDDEDVTGGPLGSLACRTSRHDDVHLPPCEVGCNVGKSIEVPFRPAQLKGEVLPLNPAQLTQLLPERIPIGCGLRGQWRRAVE